MVIRKNDKLKEIHQAFRNIDRDDRCGYVTITEVDDVLKLMYPNEFESKNLEPLFMKFTSLNSKSMISYKKFEQWIR